ncbi:DUF4383 domain-containing protein [Geodermatophilus obscurus]|jgi:hypothetical protein|uniref:DUF4383 domain-containing protein n=1 Tax=Geodermatophilus obscurus (strain ATCC 25078 / DSM 43160 / JCM 3152 / CCUG 61914 / KCC A-0152 / KCTC 9177 / NBRC 13315 / NRRL B-3577 / G-20) TaxID=526225 RepID=D2S713_GEOOG|nr:DUF4383 domain-containing protein [Geodermatophilus obscurus]ADB77505.1 conserved hypothetical protein [Geodermatophilus obscurus DSM 43160]
MSATSGNTGTGRGAMTWPQMLALAFGAIYLLVGVVGFFITGFGNFFAHDTNQTLLGFEINGMHNVVHIVVGVAGLLLGRTLAGARTYGWLLAIGYGAAFVYGLIAINKPWDFLSINAADNVLHLLTAIVGLAIALGPVRNAVTHRGTRV